MTIATLAPSKKKTAAEKYEALCPYTGSKQKKEIRDWVISHFPHPSTYTTYCEPFAGAASILLALPRAKREVLVEKCPDQAALLLTLKDHPEVFAARFVGLGLTEELEERLFTLALWFRRYAADKYIDDIARAKYQLIRNCLSWHSKGFTFKRRSKPGGKTDRPTLQRYVEKAIGATKRLKGVEIHQGDGVNWTYAHDRKSTFFYFDPPYLHSTRVSGKLYNHELGDAEHVRILERIDSLKGKVAISGYPSDLYDSFLKGPKWSRHTFAYRAVKTPRTEVLWTNY